MGHVWSGSAEVGFSTVGRPGSVDGWPAIVYVEIDQEGELWIVRDVVQWPTGQMGEIGVLGYVDVSEEGAIERARQIGEEWLDAVIV